MKIVSPRAELAVLRGLCSKDKKVVGTLIAQVDEDYFYSPESVEIYNSILSKMGESGETPAYRLLIEDPDLSENAREHLRNSQVTITTVAEATAATKTLNKFRQLRGVYNIAKHIGDKLDQPKVDIDNLLQETATAINIVRSKKSTLDSFLHFGKNSNSLKLASSILYDDNTDETIPTGIKAFDDQSVGFPRGGLVTIGANSGGGKSATASAIAVNMASLGYKVLLVPLEMSSREMTARIMANVTKTDLTKILHQKMSQEEKDLVLSKFKRWGKRTKAKGGRYTIFKPKEDMTIEEIMASINAYDSDVVIIDYISLLKGTDDDDQWRQLGSIARYAKINAEVMNRVNILLCQVDDGGKIRYARAISEHSSSSWVWVATKEAKETGIMKVEQPKSRNSLSFPFYIKIHYAQMRVEHVDITAFDENKDEESTVKNNTKSKRLANIAADV